MGIAKRIDIARHGDKKLQALCPAPKKAAAIIAVIAIIAIVQITSKR